MLITDLFCGLLEPYLKPLTTVALFTVSKLDANLAVSVNAR